MHSLCGYRNVPALVLGASGFIGLWTVRALLAYGAEIAVVIRDRRRGAFLSTVLPDPIRTIVADLSDSSAVAQAISQARPAVVFNLAGYGVDPQERDPRSMAALNAELAGTLCDALAQQPQPHWAGVRLVHVGSALEYGRVSGPLVETMAVNPTTEYGRSKVLGTRALQAHCVTSALRGVVVRLFTVYGPGERRGRLLPSLVETADKRTPLGLTSGRQQRDFTYVEDAAEGLLRIGLTAAPPGTIVNVATGRLTSVRDFAETAASVFDFPPALLRFDTLADRDDEQWHGTVDIERLQALTSWRPQTTVAEGLRRSRTVWRVS